MGKRKNRKKTRNSISKSKKSAKWKAKRHRHLSKKWEEQDAHRERTRQNRLKREAKDADDVEVITEDACGDRVYGTNSYEYGWDFSAGGEPHEEGDALPVFHVPSPTPAVLMAAGVVIKDMGGAPDPFEALPLSEDQLAFLNVFAKLLLRQPYPRQVAMAQVASEKIGFTVSTRDGVVPGDEVLLFQPRFVGPFRVSGPHDKPSSMLWRWARVLKVPDEPAPSKQLYLLDLVRNTTFRVSVKNFYNLAPWAKPRTNEQPS
jgi:hypothetical protein